LTILPFSIKKHQQYRIIITNQDLSRLPNEILVVFISAGLNARQIKYEVYFIGIKHI
jgi:hypothetical protein